MKIAEALVECGYADECFYNRHTKNWRIDRLSMEMIAEVVDPFADTLEGRRQADALEDWLTWIHDELWIKSFSALDDPTCGTGQTHHQWRLDRIKYCFEQLEKRDE